MSVAEPLLPTLKISEMQPAVPHVVDSRELFCGGRQLLILHAGHVYTLRQTKDNKLILTK